jgi:hypothetical protein
MLDRCNFDTDAYSPVCALRTYSRSEPERSDAATVVPSGELPITQWSGSEKCENNRFL